MTLETPRRVLVTGGSGFLGRGIIRELLRRHPSWKITVADVKPLPDDLADKIEHFFLTDVRDVFSVRSAFDKTHAPDLVFHTAGIIPSRSSRYSTRVKDWELVKSINCDGTRNVIDAALEAGCTRLVYTSSVTAVTDDLDHDYFNMDETTPTGLASLFYGKSKGLAEGFVLSPEVALKGLKACALRPTTIIGPEDEQVIGLIHDLIGKGETKFIIGDGDNIYDWMYIDNAVDAHMLAAENLLTTQTAARHAFFITNQEPAYFWDFLAFVWAQFDHYPPYRIHIPAWLAFVAGFIFEWITWITGAPSTLDVGSVKDGIRTHYATNEKAIQILGYRPKVGLSEGVRRSCKGFRRQLKAKAPAK